MDGELFRWVLLGLLAVGVVALLALITTLAGIKRALEERGPGTSSTSSDAAPASTSAAEAAPPARAEPMYAPAAEAPAATQAASIRTVLAQETPAAQQTPPAQAGPPTEAQPAEPAEAEAAVASAFAAHADADEPKDEPFQRDGRWWFRRGTELLLYDEASGEWQPAPEIAAPAAQAPVASPSTAATAVQPVVAAAGWKCPSCGAVNGSTAGSCRMCFTPRP